MIGTVATKAAVEYGGKEPFRYGFLDLSGTGAGPFLPLVNLSDASGHPLDPATSEGQAAAAGILQQILGALQAARAETIWTDDSGAYYLRVDNGGTLAWLTPAGGQSAPPGAGARPADAQAVLIDRAAYQATADGSGFANGDYLDHFVTVDAATGAVLQSFWMNATQASRLAAAPPAASLTPLAPLPRGAALDATLQGIATRLGSPAQDGSDVTGATMPAGGAGIRGWLSAAATSLAGILRVNVQNATIAVTGTFWQATQPVSATSLPLPSGAATDASTKAITTALGSPLQAGGTVAIADGGSASLGAKADAAAISGAASLIALLKGLIGFFVGPALVSRSVTTPAQSGSNPLFGANAARRKWLVQAPLQADLWINPLGGQASAGGLDCIRLPAGSIAQSDGICCEPGAFTYWCGTGGLNITAWEA